MRCCWFLLLTAIPAAAAEPLPAGALARLGNPALRHRARVSAVALSPDGSILASAADERAVLLTEVSTGLVLQRLPETLDQFVSLAFAPDGRTLATVAVSHASPETVLRLWDTSTGKERLHKIGADERFHPVAFSADGKLFATAGASVRVWDARTGEMRTSFRGLRGSLQQLHFAADVSVLRGLDDADTLHEWPLAGKGEQRRFRLPADKAAGTRRSALAGNGRVAFSGKDDNTALHLWDAVAGRINWQGHAHQGRSVATLVVSADGKRLASAADDRMVLVWDARIGKVLHSFNTSPAAAEVLAFSGNGARLAAGCDNGGLAVWDTSTGKAVLPTGTDVSGVHSLAWSPDGGTLAAGMQAGSIHLWDSAANTRRHSLHRHRDSILRLAFSSDGALLASGSRDRTATVWDAKTGKPRSSLTSFGGWVTCVAFSRDGAMLATSSATRENAVQVWDVSTGQSRLARPGTLATWLVAFSSDDRHLLSAGNGVSGDNWQVWDIESRLPASSALFGFSSAFACSPDCRSIVSTSAHEAHALVWERASGRVRARLELDADAREAALSRDGRLLALFGGDALTVWDLATGKQTARFGKQPSKVYALAFAPDGKTLAAGYDDSAVLLWNTSACAAPLPARTLSKREWETIWEELCGPEAEKAYRALWKLAADRGAAAAVRERLSKGLVPNERDVAQRIAELDSDRFRVRESAERQLERWGLDAVPALEYALTQKPTLEMRIRIERVLPLARERGANPEKLLISRGVELLERMATKEARAALTELARGPKDVFVTREAQAALTR